MKGILALPVICLIVSSCRAQTAASTPAQTLQWQASQAQSLYEKHSYVEAAAVLEKLAADPQITALPDWANDLYNLACDQALEGKPAQALASLKEAFDKGVVVSLDHLRTDTDLDSLHGDPQFKDLLAQLTKTDALWRDDPELATPYKPVLSEEEKVAGLSKFWAESRFNFPFFSRLPELDWDQKYMEYLPQVRGARTTADYYRVMMRFAAELRDGHTEIWPPAELSETLHAAPPFSTRLIEDKVLVTEVYDPALDALGIRVGTEIVSVDGQPVREYASSAVAPYASGSTLQDRENRTYNYMLLQGAKDAPLRLTIRNASGETKSVTAHRFCDPVSKCTWPQKSYAQFKMLPGNIAYLRINEFEDDLGARTMRDHFAAIVQDRGFILDVRTNTGGDQMNAIDLLKMLTDKPFHNVNYRTLDYKPSVRATGGRPEWRTEALGDESPDPTHYDPNPVIVLTGPGTFSAAENFVVVFNAMHRGTLVGETTPGSTGDSLIFKIPGGGAARIMTEDIEYPETPVFEGVGIAPQVKVAPSVSDIRQGRDAALERALEMLK